MDVSPEVYQPQYEYKKLDSTQIRLLRLIPGRYETELLASLETVELPGKHVHSDKPAAKVPEYEALSYYWGERSERPGELYIKILKKNQSYEVELRPNLEAALRRLRGRNRDRRLWVDALCINQKSPREKNVQIPRMHEIYNKAKRVCIWLGPEDANSTEAMEFVGKILDLDVFNRFMKDDREVQHLAYFAKLLRRPWFNRRWIVQELAVARDAQIYCGNAEVSWQNFSGAISLFSSKHMDLKKVFRSSPAFDHNFDYLGDVRELSAYQLVHAASNFFRKSEEGEILERLQSLEEIVSTLATFDASDARDVIYATISLSRDARARTEGSSKFTVDESMAESFMRSKETSPTTSPNDPYQNLLRSRRPSTAEDSSWNAGADSGFLHPEDSRRRVQRTLIKAIQAFQEPVTVKAIKVQYDAPVFEVYKDFLRLAITNSGSLDILCRPWAADDESLPSWIPGKSYATHSLRNNRAYSRVRGDFLVGSPRTGGKNYGASGETKAVWDYRPHEVLTKSLVVKGFILDSIELKLWPAMGGMIPGNWFEAFETLPQRAKPSDAFWRTLVADRGLEGEKPPPPYYALAYQYLQSRRNHMGGLHTSELMEDECPPMVKEFLERMRSVVFLRRLIISKDKTLIGLVPPETKKRDKICIIEGCSVPVVLREILMSTPEKVSKKPGGAEPTSRAASSVPLQLGGDRAGKTLASLPTPPNPVRDTMSLQVERPGSSSITKRRPSIVLQTVNNTNPAKTEIQRLIQASQPGSETGTPIDSHDTASPALDPPKTPTTDRERPRAATPIDNNDTASPAPDSSKIPVPDGEGPTTATTQIPWPGEADEIVSNFAGSRRQSWKIPDRYYKFVGECYIHGMMDGEAMKFSVGENVKKEFWLR